MEQVLLAYSLPKETIATIMMLYKNTKVKVHSPDWNTDFFDIVTGVPLENTLTPYLFIICLDFVLQMLINLIKENGFTLAKARSRRYPTWTLMNIDYTDDIALLANTPTQAESLLHSLEQVAGGINLHVNTDKTEFMCFNQRADICTVNGRSLKLVDKFTYLRSSISSTENDINTWLAKAINYQLYGSQTSQIRIKHCFSKQRSHVSTTVWIHNMDTN